MNKISLNHISFILDGNKRWARRNNLNETDGYKKGINKIYEIVQYCYKNKIEYVTMFLLSTENLKRSNKKSFINLAKITFREFIEKINNIGRIKVNVIGEKINLSDDIISLIKELETQNIKNYNLTLNLAFNYGFNNELYSVIKKILSTSDKDFDESKINDYFYLNGQPDPDVLIRTGGYKRLSNFILKNLIYTELNFIDTLWPDLSLKELDEIIKNFKKINRNYGL